MNEPLLGFRLVSEEALLLANSGPLDLKVIVHMVFNLVLDFPSQRELLRRQSSLDLRHLQSI